MKIRDCDPEEFDRRAIRKVTSFGMDGSVEYTITYKDGKLVIDNKKYQEMLAKHPVMYKGKVYKTSNPQEWLHGYMYEGNAYSNTEFEFAD